MTNFAYLRVSTDKQDESSQRHIITSAIPPGTKDDTIWVLDKTSGGTPWQDRKISFILDTAKPGDTIFVSEISRIARSTIGVLTFLQVAASLAVNVSAVKSGIKLDDSVSSKIVVTILGLAAEIERDLLRERTKGALAARKARGLPVGRQTGATNRVHKLDGLDSTITTFLKAGISTAAIARLHNVSRATMTKKIKTMEKINHD